MAHQVLKLSVTRAASVVACVALSALLCGLSACGGEPPPPPKPAIQPPVAPIAPSIDLAPAAWGEVRSERFGVSLRLPEMRAWTLDDRTTSWIEARHAPTGSTVLVRMWSEDERMNRQRCEERARLMRKLPEREGAGIVDKRAVKVPPEFDTNVEVGVVAPAKPGGPTQGFVIAFGGRARRCFAYVFTTTVMGDKMEEALGDRLVSMVDGSLVRLDVHNDLVPSIPRHADPGAPPREPLTGPRDPSSP
jgi:hypothetical protein